MNKFIKQPVTIALIIIILISLFFNLFRKNSSPPCFNADEAAFSYNAYSLLKTGKDEYGATLPLRLKSFGDNKMPLYSYLSIPFIAVLGLTENSARLLNTFVACLFPLIIYLLVYELFKKKSIALLSALFIAISPAINLVGRHAHEAYLTAFLITTTIFSLIKLINSKSLKYLFLLLVTVLLSLFSYHSSRLFAAIFFFILIYYIWRKKLPLRYLFIFLIFLLPFIVSDLIYKQTRIENLLFFNSKGYQLKTKELVTEGGLRYLYQPLLIGIKDISLEYMTYFSPEFLVKIGDQNPRFGLEGVSLVTPIEYVFVFIGIYFLFRNKEKWRYLILVFLLFAPFSAALAWAKGSLTRSFFLLIPLLILSAYGIINLLYSLKKFRFMLAIVLFIAWFFYLILSWDFYLFHYPKRALVSRSWQCGYKELVNYIQDNYNNFDQFYITKQHGQPYIFLLFYLKYPPEKYQQQANLSPPDEYGFGQVETFDKFIFDFKVPTNRHRKVLIGYPDSFTNLPTADNVDLNKVKVIKYGTEDIFWIYEMP